MVGEAVEMAEACWTCQVNEPIDLEYSESCGDHQLRSQKNEVAFSYLEVVPARLLLDTRGRWMGKGKLKLSPSVHL